MHWSVAKHDPIRTNYMRLMVRDIIGAWMPPLTDTGAARRQHFLCHLDEDLFRLWLHGAPRERAL